MNIGSADLLNPATTEQLNAGKLILSGMGHESFASDFNRAMFPSPDPDYAIRVIVVLSSAVSGYDSTLQFNQTDTTTISADIGGGGRIVQRGSGTTILTGNSNETQFLYQTMLADLDYEFIFGAETLAPLGFRGTVLVENGTLPVNGVLTSTATTVKEGATLGGSGLITQILLEEGGMLSPGNSVGTLTSDTLTWNCRRETDLRTGRRRKRSAESQRGAVEGRHRRLRFHLPGFRLADRPDLYAPSIWEHRFQ